jgi:hypothetical protein
MHPAGYSLLLALQGALSGGLQLSVPKQLPLGHSYTLLRAYSAQSASYSASMLSIAASTIWFVSSFILFLVT